MSAEHITIADVRNKVRLMAEIARAAGFDTSDWGVQRGTRHYSLLFTTSEGMPKQVDLGGTAREACGRMDFMILGMTEMAAQMEPSRHQKIMGAALRASAKLEEHRHKCSYCALHLVGAKANWCSNYLRLLEIWRDGIVLANADHKQKYPIGSALTHAIAG